MSMTPEYGEEELLKQESQGYLARDREGTAEREIEDHEREEREVNYLEPDGNEARAAGEVCERCGEVITASQDVRRLPDGHWQHEVCPRDPGLPSAGSTEP